MNTTLVLVIAILSVLLYAAAAFFVAKEKWEKIGYILWGAAFFGNLVMVANNWIINGYVPFVSMYQVMTFISMCFGPVYVYMRYWHKSGWMSPYFCAMPAVFLIGVCFMGIGSVWHQPPALQSVWFVPHILAYMLSYSLISVAFVLAVMRFIDKKNAQRLEKGIYDPVSTAFPFMTMAMFFGAIWANEVWGNFWSFDAKENWALMTWLMYTLYLHFRRQASLKKYAKIFVILGFVCMIVTLFGVNLMGGTSQHAYTA
jgi:ABC-type transport system involved in cytochrome c biogenesis permease subunit